MQAISTRYHGPGNVRGSVIIARAAGGASVRVGYDDALDSDGNHLAAALALCRKLGWKGQIVGGGTRDGYAFVFAASTPRGRA